MALLLVSAFLFAAPALAQVATWGQCGGTGYSGATTCASGTSCIKLNDYYSQCQPGNAATTTTAVTTTTSVATTSSPTSSSVSSSSSGTASSPSTPSSCTSPVANPTSSSIPKLNDPFLKVSGSRITTKADWDCRRDEISQLFQVDELGTMPPKPQSVTGTLSGNTLTISVSDNGKSISFTGSITYPSGSGPFPAIIAYGGMSIPTPAGVAVVTFSNDDIAAQTDSSSRGKGKFYTLYGSGHSAGAMTAWAWAVSRIVDALETTANTKINVKRLGVTGCSRNGKGALVAGAFEQRIALTIPQESGSGGSACWRLSDYQKSSGTNVQTASEIIGENVWFSTLFNPFVNKIPYLPVDHHELAGMVAPRGLFVIENTSMEWLGALSTYGCMKAAHTIYEALGVPDSMGYSQVGGHDHCAFPSSQQSDLNAFVQKFLLDQSTNTNIMRTDGTYNYDSASWQPWTVPTLS